MSLCGSTRVLLSALGTAGACQGRNLSSLSAIPHPTQLSKTEFCSETWRHAVRQMYRAILKLHRTELTPMQRELGDRFVRAEFQRHVDTTEKYARIFYESWYGYIAQLSSGQTTREMTAEEYRLLSEEQKESLRELRSKVVQARQTDPDFML